MRIEEHTGDQRFTMQFPVKYTDKVAEFDDLDRFDDVGRGDAFVLF